MQNLIGYSVLLKQNREGTADSVDENYNRLKTDTQSQFCLVAKD